MPELPVVVVGAGPIGLAAAAELVERGLEPVVLERAAQPGAAVAQWGHVRLFSRWQELVDPAARRLLEATGWRHPDQEGYPTGAEWIEQYLRPLAVALADRIRYDADVVGVARRGRDLVVNAGRDEEPLAVHVRTSSGVEERILARAVIDASGTWGSPNPLGADGVPAQGEVAAADRITYRMPDFAEPGTRRRYADRHVVVVGSGHSAMTALVGLEQVATEHQDTRVTWLLRRGRIGDAFGGGSADQLPARGALGQRARSAVEAGRVTVATGFRVDSVEWDGADGLVLVSQDGERIVAVDEVVVLTGFRPDLSWLSEVRLDLDPALEAPAQLAPLIDPNVHSCGTVPPHGVGELAHPEPGLFLAGMKSYGRAPTFLALTGYEQVRSIAAALAGDRVAAEQVQLVLPETGVCSGQGLADASDGEPSGGCCGPPAVPEAVEFSTSPAG
ncbi:MAG: FAD-dependent oxidoreductase [Actinomycetota bacterium]